MGDRERIVEGMQVESTDVPLHEHDHDLTHDHTFPPSNSSSESSNSRQLVIWPRKKFVMAVSMIALIIFVTLDSATNQHVTAMLHDFLTWVQTNPIPGLLTYTMVYFISVIFLVPGSILTLGAGFVFCNEFGLAEGIVAGTLVVFVGASLGAMAAFLLGRFLFRDCLTPILNQYKLLQSLDMAFEHQGLRIMVLLHLSPIVPFSILSYVAAVTSISFRNYVMALIAILPATIMYVVLGASAGSLADLNLASLSDMEENETLTVILVVLGALFGILAVAYISYYAKKEIALIEQHYALQNGPILSEESESKILEDDEIVTANTAPTEIV